MITLEFLITSLIVVLVPGTGVVYTVSTGLTRGRRASVFAAVGCTLGILPHLLTTVLGLAAVMHTSALAFQLLKYAGVAYLFYLAVATWRDRSAFAVDGSMSMAPATALVLKAFLLNILNPKLTIFFLAACRTWSLGNRQILLFGMKKAGICRFSGLFEVFSSFFSTAGATWPCASNSTPGRPASIPR